MTHEHERPSQETGAPAQESTATTTEPTVTEQVKRAKALLAHLRQPVAGEARRAARQTYEPRPLLADLGLLTAEQCQAWNAGDYWAVVGAVFVADGGDARLVSLADARRWVA